MPRPHNHLTGDGYRRNKPNITMPTIEVESDIFFTYRGINIYHVYKDDDKDNGIVRDYAYSFDAHDSDSELIAGFFADELTQWKANAAPSYRNGNNFYEAVKKTIREAIDLCELDEQIEASGQTLPDRFLNYYTHLDCPNMPDNIPAEWTDASPHTNNDKCECGAEIEPWKSEDLPVEETEICDECKTVLTLNDEAYTDTETGKPLCDRHSWQDADGNAHRVTEIEIQRGYSDAERDTILAALRFWQDRDAFYSGGRVEALQDIATNGGEHPVLTNDEIDALCERIN